MSDLFEFLLASLEHFLEPQATLYHYLSAQIGDLKPALFTLFRVISVVTEIVWGVNLFVNAADQGKIPPIIGLVLVNLSKSKEGCFVLIAAGLFLLGPCIFAFGAVGPMVFLLWSFVTAQISLWVFATGAFSLGRNLYYKASLFITAFLVCYILSILIRLGHVEALFSATIITLSGVSVFNKLSEVREFSALTCFSLSVLCIAFNLLAGYYIELISTSSSIIVLLLSHSFWLVFAAGLVYEYLRYTGRLYFR